MRQLRDSRGAGSSCLTADLLRVEEAGEPEHLRIREQQGLLCVTFALRNPSTLSKERERDVPSPEFVGSRRDAEVMPELHPTHVRMMKGLCGLGRKSTRH